MLLLVIFPISLLFIYVIWRVRRRVPLAEAGIDNLASQTVPDGSRSCPDLPSAHDTTPDSDLSLVNPDAAFETASLRTGLQEEQPSLRQRTSSKLKSSKVRRLVGRARDFRRIATARMADGKQPERGRSSENGSSAEQEEGSDVAEESSVEKGEKPSIPAFLTQSYADLRKKFMELEWLQRDRASAGALSRDPTHQWALESSPDVRERNRYVSVQPWAQSRIHLKVPAGECDFINASPIVLKDMDTQEDVRYIASQGPKDGYLAHFWSMVYHETGEVAVVVMLTQAFEGGREKCAQYFPVNMDAPTLEFSSTDSAPFVEQDLAAKANDHLYGTVTLLDCSYDENLRSEIRKFELRVGFQTKIVWHYLFAGWSDFMKPEGPDREAVLRLTTATSEKASSPSNPRIVHCSAGVGRTGTFIALDHLLRGLKSGKLLDLVDDTVDTVFDTVNQLREQRMMMVYNDFQYQFIHEVLKEQIRAQLGQDTDETSESSSKPRAGKLAKLSSDPPFEPTPKAELEPMADTHASTPTGSFSGTPEASDNES